MEELHDFLYSLEDEIKLSDNPVDVSELYDKIKDKVTVENKIFLDLILSYYSLGIAQNHKYRPASP